jgi:hypothetical protein
MISRFIVVLFLLISIELKVAKAQDKGDKQEDKSRDKWQDTDSPSKAPYIKPSRSKAPFLTDSPTQIPNVPLQMETKYPSLFPSHLTASISPVVEDPPHDKSFTSKPSSTPIQILPSIVPMPKVEIMFRLTASTFILSDIELELVAFMKQTLLSNQHILGNITLMELKAKVAPATKRRRLEIKMNAVMEGTILFSKNKKPSTEEITKVLFSYFSNWGNEELQNYLTDDQITVTDVEIVIEGKIIGGTEKSIAGSQSLPASNSGKVNVAFIGLVVAIVIACGVCFLALSFLLRLKKMRRRKPEELEITPLSSPSRSQSNNEVVSKDRQPNVVENDSRSLSGVSLEDSLYTSNSHNTTNKSVSDYDPKRLDRVISKAKEFVMNHEKEMGMDVPKEVKVSSLSTEIVNCSEGKTKQGTVTSKDERDVSNLEAKKPFNVLQVQHGIPSSNSSLENSIHSQEREFRAMVSKSIGSGEIKPPNEQNQNSNPLSITSDLLHSLQEIESTPLTETPVIEQNLESCINEQPTLISSLSKDDERVEKLKLDSSNSNSDSDRQSSVSVVQHNNENSLDSTKLIS